MNKDGGKRKIPRPDRASTSFKKGVRQIGKVSDENNCEIAVRSGRVLNRGSMWSKAQGEGGRYIRRTLLPTGRGVAQKLRHCAKKPG